MRRVALLILALLAAPATAAPKPPVVVELFTAQGCASCPEANAIVGKLADREGVLPLTYSMDYWDYLGWPDTFARPEFDQRQKAYVARMALSEPYTPQVVVDGQSEASGLQAEKIDQMVRQAARAPRNPPDVAFFGARRADVGSGRPPRGGAEVWLVRYDPRERDVEVRSGDNKGQIISHRNVVREIVRLGAWKGRPTAYRLPKPTEEGLVTLLLVQTAKGGRIIAAARR